MFKLFMWMKWSDWCRFLRVTESWKSSIKPQSHSRINIHGPRRKPLSRRVPKDIPYEVGLHVRSYHHPYWCLHVEEYEINNRKKLRTIEGDWRHFRNSLVEWENTATRAHTAYILRKGIPWYRGSARKIKIKTGEVALCWNVNLYDIRRPRKGRI